MTRFVAGDDRSQSTLVPEWLDDYLGEDNPVRAIDVLKSLLCRASLQGDQPVIERKPSRGPTFGTERR
jgi:hypothetical protein